MPLRVRTSIFLAFAFLFLYLVFPFSHDSPSLGEGARVVNALTGSQGEHGGEAEAGLAGTPAPAPSPTFTSTQEAILVTSSTFPTIPGATTGTVTGSLQLQKQFEKQYDALGVKETVGAIFSNTLNNLVDSGGHAGPHATFLTRTGDWIPYSDASPYIYSPYPDYNKKAWRAANQGSYVACAGPDEIVPEVKVFSGHPEAFGESPIGSYVPFGIDSNLCFERGTRLAPYGFKEEQATYSDGHLRKRMDWDLVNWGVLQDFCLTKNADRYVKLDKLEPIKEDKKDLSNFSISGNSTGKLRRLETVVHETNSRDQGPHGKPEVRVMAKSRTAILLRSYTGRKYTQNDKQNIRALVTELSLRSGGEYQVFLLLQIKDDLPLSKESVRAHVPKEFWDMVIPWNDNLMKEKYPRIPEEVNNVHQSQWLSVQFFVQEHPEFDYFWNWELDTRYTGHHYNFLEKLVAFAQAQPRKGLWERNERYYIPSVHGPYDTKFRKTVEKLSGSQSIWGAAYMPIVKPVGPSRPIDDPKYDDYEWGVGEEADYISLAPIFNPANTTWPGRDDVWGYDGADRTPRRATIGTQSRCSRKLLEAMHAENLEGNHVSSEMTPQTVALLHGLKAVYAPMPVFFDRAWNGEMLEKYFNPGPNGVSGSSEESPFSWGKESRFNGSTWYYRAVPPKRLYNNWMGWEDSGIGGPEWETLHGRPCLPPMLLHPVKDVAKPPPGHSSKSDLPYP